MYSFDLNGAYLFKIPSQKQLELHFIKCKRWARNDMQWEIHKDKRHNSWSKKVSSKFSAYEFRVCSEFQFVTAYWLFLNINSQLSMVQSLYWGVKL
jgi:hypothetical protein